MEINYEKFSSERCKILMEVQEKFREEFNLNSYANWFYDSELELLRLYDDDSKQVFFRYIPVGTFSLKTRTWMWSWFNKHSIEPGKEKVLAAKDFGFKNHFSKLTEGTFDADEYDCWEFTAIAFHLLGGIGTYKTASDHLETFMLLTEVLEIDSPEVIKFNQKKVDCAHHGLSRAAYVCRHLDLVTSKGFEEAFETFKDMDLDDDDDFQAWCDECEKIRFKFDGWNEESEKFADIRLVCEDCYFELKSFNKTT